ncbi:MDR family MFS transporter [Cohnella caldifontis]|uniref:MDR family MFS transporter n=1 Tax=Cohnella caldifontis TaxID=3027471 RepID=UPI0023EC1D10|nr:MDR family MFS transporter [Cohnella sp. YIM B05605]
MDSKKSNVNLVVTGLLLGLFMVSLDQTIVSTAMANIIKKLGGMESFIWVYSAYMIAMVVSTPILGKLSDMYGRKRFFLLGLVLFVVGSIMCGTATNMEQLIVYRAIQGIGGGAVMPIVFTIIFDLFPQEKRGKMMGLFGAVFGISSIFGPLLGGTISDGLSWRWIFYINVPIGLLSILFIWMGYRETKQTRKQIIDWTGAILLTAGILCLMFALELGGTDGWAWGSWKIVSLLAASGALLVLFLLAERMAKDPIVNLSLFRSNLFTGSMMVGLLYGGAMMAGATYIPIFVQGVFHQTATQTTTVLIPMMLGSVVSAQIGGRIAGKFRFRDVMIVSALMLTAGLSLLAFAMDTSTSRLIISLYMIVVGLGMGVSFSLLNISTLSSVPPQYKGSASSLIAFFRTIGSALGITVFGVLQKHDFQEQLRDVPNLNPQLAAQIKGGQALLDPAVQAQMGMSPDAVNALLSRLADSIIYVFQWSVILPVIALVFVFLMGRARLSAMPAGAPAAGGGQGRPDASPDNAAGTEPSFHGG